MFDEPEVAAAKHRAGLRRLFALQIKDALKYLEKNIPDLQKMARAPTCRSGTLEELREQIIDVALDRAFLLEPLPTDEAAFKRRVDEGRGRLTLIANEVARLAGAHPGRVRGGRAQDQGHEDASRRPRDDAAQQLQRLVPKRFLAGTPWAQLQHFPRYLKAHHAAAGQAARRPGARCGAAGRAAAAGAALLAPGGRAQGRGRRAHGGVPLAAGGAARELLRAGAAHAAAGERQAAGQGVGAARIAEPRSSTCGVGPNPITGHRRHWLPCDHAPGVLAMESTAVSSSTAPQQPPALGRRRSSMPQPGRSMLAPKATAARR